MVEALKEVSLPTDQNSETPIPRYTDWDSLNMAISQIASGNDEEHPAYGLGDSMLFHGDTYRFKKRDGWHVSQRIVFRSEGERELSYLISLRPDGSVGIRSEGWQRHLDKDEYAKPAVKPQS